MNSDILDVTVNEGVATITLQRSPVNALSLDLYNGIISALNGLEADGAARCVLLRSAFKVWCAGADLKEVSDESSWEYVETREAASSKAFNSIREFPYPVIAVIDGLAIGGGCALAAVCDMRVASQTAGFWLREIDAGRVGGARSMMRLLPQGTVRRMAFSGEALYGPDLYRLGAVDILVDSSDALTQESTKLARSIVAKSGIALRMAKVNANQVEEATLSQGMHMEYQMTARLSQSPEGEEAMASFMEKRPPVWKHA
jgi:enoyl-CoA hydratase